MTGALGLESKRAFLAAARMKLRAAAQVDIMDSIPDSRAITSWAITEGIAGRFGRWSVA
jgi:hypothetical protein